MTRWTKFVILGHCLVDRNDPIGAEKMEAGLHIPWAIQGAHIDVVLG